KSGISSRPGGTGGTPGKMKKTRVRKSLSSVLRRLTFQRTRRLSRRGSGLSATCFAGNTYRYLPGRQACQRPRYCSWKPPRTRPAAKISSTCRFKKRCRVWFWNQEDPREELERRLAAICRSFAVKDHELFDEDGRPMLYLNSGVDRPLMLATSTG